MSERTNQTFWRGVRAWFERSALFLRIVWRRFDDRHPSRMDAATAWRVTKILRGEAR